MILVIVDTADIRRLLLSLEGFILGSFLSLIRIRRTYDACKLYVGYILGSHPNSVVWHSRLFFGYAVRSCSSTTFLAIIPQSQIAIGVSTHSGIPIPALKTFTRYPRALNPSPRPRVTRSKTNQKPPRLWSW